MKLLPLIPKRLRADVAEIPRKQSAYYLILEALHAAPKMVPSDRELLTSLGSRSPSTSQEVHLRRIIASRAALYRKVDRLTRRYPFSLPTSSDLWHMVDSKQARPIRDMIKELAYETDLFLRAGDVQTARAKLLLAIRLTLAFSSGAHTTGDVLYAQAHLPIALVAAKRLAIHPASKTEDIQLVVAALPADVEKDTRIAAVKQDLHSVASYLETCTLEQAYQEIVTTMDKRKLKGHEFLHREPLDRKHTLDILIAAAEEALEDIRLGWHADRRLHVLAEAEKDLTVRSDWWMPFGVIPPGPYFAEDHPLIDHEVRREFWVESQRISNPIGRLLAASTFPYGRLTQEANLHSDVHYACVRTLVALRLYKLRHKSYPARLENLVSNGILSSVPLDPASGRPLRYDRGRKLLWSIGVNGEDDGGLGKEAIYRGLPDCVYKLL